MVYNYLFLFHSQHGLKKLKSQLHANAVESSVTDAPRKVSTECETALIAGFNTENAYLDYTGENIREIWRISGSDYKQVWMDRNA
ncbi:hypothetical protein F4V73_04215 [Morganella psychrotolerans]|uniref:Uncharacterized protein n=1 Tax=Morganella psychrotolerans TaxID=368603 RepID=A0A5M9RCV0_9GAMM|nr:hypothetical protein F4V73_04215 [Morganella psychrotolerans]